MINTIKNLLRPYKTKLIMLKAYFIRKKNKKLNPDFKCSVNTRRCFNNEQSPNYCYEYFGENTPVCCATHLYNILTNIAKTLENHNLEYFISFGTLLGAVRHGGLIPWDTDIDIVIAQKNRDKVFETLKNELGNSYNVKEDRENNIVGSLIRVDLSDINTLHIDLFTYLEKDSEEIIFGYNRSFNKKDIYPLQKIKFYDSEFYAPKEIDKQLKLFYGEDYMRYGYKQWAYNKTKFRIEDSKPAKIER